MQTARNLPAMDDIREGAAIVNANGITGTLGCFALTRNDHQLVFLTSHHVLFGSGAREQEGVWLAAHKYCRPMMRTARARVGRCGTVIHDGREVFVDCATAELDPRLVPQECDITPENGECEIMPGDGVYKTGAVTGRTKGVVVDTDYKDTVRVAGRRRRTSGQILVRPVEPDKIFSTEGDSGAVVRNANGAIVGVLWGVDARGFGLACPIAPVLWVLHLHLVHIQQQETS